MVGLKSAQNSASLSPEIINAREEYAIQEQAFQDPNARPHRIIGIGAGASGIVRLIAGQIASSKVELTPMNDLVPSHSRTAALAGCRAGHLREERRFGRSLVRK